jgi:hypothetical protein
MLRQAISRQGLRHSLNLGLNCAGCNQNDKGEKFRRDHHHGSIYEEPLS